MEVSAGMHGSRTHRSLARSLPPVLKTGAPTGAHAPPRAIIATGRSEPANGIARFRGGFKGAAQRGDDALEIRGGQRLLFDDQQARVLRPTAAVLVPHPRVGPGASLARNRRVALEAAAGFQINVFDTAIAGGFR